MLFIYEHIVNSLFFSRKYVIILTDKFFENCRLVKSIPFAESVPNKNASNQWLEAMDEEEYLKLK